MEKETLDWNHPTMVVLRLGCRFVLTKRGRQERVNLVVRKREFATLQSFSGYCVGPGRSAGSEFVRCRNLQSKHVQRHMKVCNVGIRSVAMGEPGERELVASR
jgi:hypothetical protein